MATLLALMTHVPRPEGTPAPARRPTLFLDHTWNHDRPSDVVVHGTAGGGPSMGTLGQRPKTGAHKALPRKGTFPPYTMEDHTGATTFVPNALTRTLADAFAAVLGGTDDPMLAHNGAKYTVRSACVGLIEGRDFLLLTRHTGRAHRPFDLFSPTGLFDGHAPGGWPHAWIEGRTHPQRHGASGQVDQDTPDPHALLVGHVYVPGIESAHARVARAARIRADLDLLSRFWDGQNIHPTAPTAFLFAFAKGTTPIFV